MAENEADLSVGLRLMLGLTLQETKLMLLLMQVELVTANLVNERLGIPTADVRIAIHRLRNMLHPHNITIQSKRLFGYWLTDDTKARVRQLTQRQAA